MACPSISVGTFAESTTLAGLAAALRRAIRRASMLCPACGKRPPAAGRAACPECLAAIRAAADRFRAKARAAGLCPGCGRGRPQPGRSYCAACAARDRRYAKRKRIVARTKKQEENR